MFRLIRWLIGMTLLGALAYGAVTVPLGGRTLWGHLKAIAGTEESKALVDGVKKKAKAVSGDADRLTAKERNKLRKLIRDRLADDKKASKKGTSAGTGSPKKKQNGDKG